MKMKAYRPYEVGDWIVPRMQAKPVMFEVVGFSGNFVFGIKFGDLNQNIESLQKSHFTKATKKDIARVIAHRLKGKS